jgi:hypothetical protein
VTIELALLSQVRYGGLEITGSRLQDLLALLAEDPHVGCSTSRLVDALWPNEQPEHPVKAVQILVSRARTRLGPGVIISSPCKAGLIRGRSTVPPPTNGDAGAPPSFTGLGLCCPAWPACA